MSITKRDIMHKFNVESHQVEQEGSKQCFVVYQDGLNLFVSYLTTVGFCHGTDWYFTEEKHSVTTAKQIGDFSASRSFLPEEVFNEALSGNTEKVLKAYNLEVHKRKLMIESFTTSYRVGMITDSTTHDLIAQAENLILLDKNLYNRITREVKADKIAELVDYEADSAALEKRYGKYKAKLAKAIKGAL